MGGRGALEGAVIGAEPGIAIGCREIELGTQFEHIAAQLGAVAGVGSLQAQAVGMLRREGREGVNDK